MTNIYGSIGFSFLFDNDRKRYILLLADMHSKLSYCDNNFQIIYTISVVVDSPNVPIAISSISHIVVIDKLLESIIVTEGINVHEISTFDKKASNIL